MSLDSNALVTLANFKAYINEDGNTFDSLFEILINDVSTLMQMKIGRELVYEVYSEQKLDGNGKHLLDIPNYPIVEVTELKIYGNFSGWETLTEDEDFIVYPEAGYMARITSGELNDIDTKWGKGRQNIKITYKAGYWVAPEIEGVSEMPKDLQLACMKQVAYEWKQQKGKLYGETSRSYPDGSTSYVPVADLLDSTKKICERYKRIHI